MLVNAGLVLLKAFTASRLLGSSASRFAGVLALPLGSFAAGLASVAAYKRHTACLVVLCIRVVSLHYSVCTGVVVRVV